MKNITITNNKIDLFKAKALTFILAVLVIVLFTNSIKSSIKMLQDDYLTNVEQELVAVVEYEKATEYLQITTKDAEEKEVIYFAQFKLDDFNSKVNVGDIIKIGFAASGTNNMVYFLQNGDTNIIDLRNVIKTSGKSTLIFSIVCVVLVVAFVAWKVIEIMIKPKTETHEYVNYALSQENLITNKMMNKNSQTRKYMNTYNIFCAVFVGVLLLTFMFINSLITLLGDAKVIVFIIFGVVMVGYLALLFVFVPKFNSKQSEQYAKDYFDYLHNGPTFVQFYTPYEFKDLSKTIQTSEDQTEEVIKTDEKVLVYSKKGQEFSYDINTLNLYVVGVYRKYFYGGNIFLATDRQDLGEKEVDFIIPLTFEIYNQIKDMEIEVKGLDYLEEHFQEEIVNNTMNKGKKNVIVKYNN